MTKDVVALVRGAPDLAGVLGGLVAAGAELRVRGLAGGGVVQLCDDDERPLVSIEVPVLVQVPGELERLLGPEVADVEPPVWWVEARAVEGRDGSEVLALRFAAELARRFGGVVWGDGPYLREALEQT